MSDDAESLWRAFLAESDEHLAAVENLLTGGEAREWSGAEIADLFRGFHSLKGLSQAMDLTHMQAIAHRAEDLLGLVREGKVLLDPLVAATLLDVVDQLRGMRDHVETHRSDIAADRDLFGRLDRLMPQGHAAPAQEQGGGAPVSVALADDPDMLAVYCELLHEAVPDFIEALAAGDGGIAADRADELTRGAEVVGLDQLAADLTAMAAQARALPDPDAREAMVMGLAGLRQQLSLIEELAGVPAGADALAEGLVGHARRMAGARVVALSRTLGDVVGSDRASLLTAVAAASAARQALDAAGLPEAASIVLLVEEQLSRAAQDEFTWVEAHAELAADMLRAVEGLEGDLDPGEAAALQVDWQTRIRGDGQKSAAVSPVTAALQPELRASLTDRQLAHLERRVGEGWRVYDLLSDTESEPELAGDLAAWLSANTDVVTTRTVSAGGLNWFEFLFTTRHEFDHVRAAFTALDPDQRCVRGLREVGAAQTATPAGDQPARASAVIRVRVDAVEDLMDGLDEMRITLGGLAEALAGVRAAIDAARGGLGDGARLIEERLAIAEDIRQRIDAMHRDVRADCIALRVVPVDTVFARFPRMVRELAHRLQREVEFEISGRDARLDKSMADILVDPLMHLVRNALDHGIEQPAERVVAGKPRRARLLLAATEHADGVHISVRDDGRGLNRDAILARAIERGLVSREAVLSEREVYDLLFRSGFSTAVEVTEISGRGVGLDVVAHTLARIGGTIDIETTPGAGTCFTLHVPTSASLQNVLLVDAGERVAIPERRVVGAITLESVEQIGADRVIWYGGTPVPLHDLHALLGFPGGDAPPEAAIIVSDGTSPVALAIDRAPQRREVFLKELHPLLGGLRAVAGATLLSDGTPALVLDVDGLLELARERAVD